jgi:hypothetical protein
MWLERLGGRKGIDQFLRNLLSPKTTNEASR